MLNLLIGIFQLSIRHLTPNLWQLNSILWLHRLQLSRFLQNLLYLPDLSLQPIIFLNQVIDFLITKDNNKTATYSVMFTE